MQYSTSTQFHGGYNKQAHLKCKNADISVSGDKLKNGHLVIILKSDCFFETHTFLILRMFQ